MGRAAAATRTSVLSTTAQALDAVETVRALANTLASQVTTLTQENLERNVAIETCLSAVKELQAKSAYLESGLTDISAAYLSGEKARVQAADGLHSKVRKVDTAYDAAVAALADAAVAKNFIARPFLGRLRWLVTGR